VTGLEEIARMAGEAEGWLGEYDCYRGLVWDEEAQTTRAMTFWDSRVAEANTRAGRQGRGSRSPPASV
jgi:hypothetical protein